MDYFQKALELHEQLVGKLETVSKSPLETTDDLSTVYSPGVAEPCKEIAKNPDDVYKYTLKANTVAVVSDGSAVLGLGNIGAEAGIPVMEGKCLLFKTFAGLNAFPICLDTQDTEEIIEIVKKIAPVFGGINLEDIAAPRCFEIEKRLIDELDIPVFHDDQHGTAIVTLAGLVNALKLTNKTKEDVKIVMNGAGAAGIAIADLLMDYGFKKITMCDSKGVIFEGRGDLNSEKERIAKVTNLEKIEGTLDDVMKGADIFIGVSVAETVTKDMVRSMNDKPIIFAMANPIPEIMPEDANEAGAYIIATGRSDYPNQVNNVLAFTGIFKGASEAQSPKITDKMKIAAGLALANMVESPTPEKVIPNPFDPGIAEKVAEAVKLEV